MKIIWSGQNYEIEVPYKNVLCSLQHNGERPDKIVIDLDEVPTLQEFSPRFIEYIERDVRQAVRGRKSTVKIIISGIEE